VDISVLGTGTMGTAVASGLLKAGHRVTVWNRRRERAHPLVARGAHAADTAEEAIRASCHTILVFSDERATRQVLFANGTREALRDRPLASAVAMAPEECLALAKDVKAAGGRLSDIQITTYPDRVEDRSSEFLLACDPQDKEDWERIFGSLGNKIHDVGTVGNASKAAIGLAMSSSFLTAAIAYSVAAFNKMELSAKVSHELLAGSLDVAMAEAKHCIPEMSQRTYGTGPWTVDNMVALIDTLAAFASNLNLDKAPFGPIGELYAKAASMGYGGRNVTAVYEALNPRSSA
jgi:3-hydroxyisobutyrate dehydrogenase-like beta-hydroxyacid dehydrogenase